MSVKIVGQSGAPTELNASDDVFGLLTQVPEGGVFHSQDGLTGGDGNTAYGNPFQLVAYAEQAASGTTTVNLCASDAPYAFLVTGAEVHCLDDGKGASEGGQNGCVVGISQGGASGIGSVDCGGIKTGEKRKVETGLPGNGVVPADGSLRVMFKSRLGLHDKAFTYKLLCTLSCIRVVS